MVTLKKHFDLILGIFFILYGISRKFWIFPTEQVAFNVILSIAFIALGVWDIYRYKTRKFRYGS